MTANQTDSIRSATMRAVKSKDTKPELLIRSILHRLGYRYRLHNKDLPGKPDIVFAGRKKIIFIHGCFWHGHDCARGNRMPKTNYEYWVQKITRNKERDTEHNNALVGQGWQNLTLWECEISVSNELTKRLIRFLG